MTSTATTTRVIRKYRAADDGTVQLPADSQLLGSGVGQHRGNPVACLWAAVEVDGGGVAVNERVTLHLDDTLRVGRVVLLATGEAVPDGARHLGTSVEAGGAFVRHAFLLPDADPLAGTEVDPALAAADDEQLLREHIAEQQPLADAGSETAAREVANARQGLADLQAAETADGDDDA